ncbi:hypothetical protein QFZ23_004360 [Arthrobacter globiformis]|uniref:hypothetical protein n=1 Tax=Arthrobacter globiformis TaxID=1665 RepID=UPI00277DA2C6|nr:hypothetical protein [Arthrobacter globiformis]MDQ1060459.1 hypothetical protein [Arthrobacter globiformis]
MVVRKLAGCKPASFSVFTSPVAARTAARPQRRPASQKAAVLNVEQFHNCSRADGLPEFLSQKLFSVVDPMAESRRNRMFLPILQTPNAGRFRLILERDNRDSVNLQ